MGLIRDTILGILFGAILVLSVGAYVFRAQLGRLARYFKDWLEQDARQERENHLLREERLKAARELDEELVEPNHLEQ